MRRKLTVVISLLLIVSLTLAGQPEKQEKPFAGYKDVLTKILGFFYTIAHLIGQGIIDILHLIIPSLIIPKTLIDPIGVLALLTAFLTLAEFAKRVTWIVIVVGWLLIAARIGMVALKIFE